MSFAHMERTEEHKVQCVQGTLQCNVENKLHCKGENMSNQGANVRIRINENIHHSHSC